MGILKNIFGKKINSRSRRFFVGKYHSASIEIGGKSYDLTNVSVYGLGIKNPDINDGFELQSTHHVKLNLADTVLEFNTRVVHVNEEILGMAVTANLETYAKTIQEYFRCEIDAFKTRELDPKKLQVRGDGSPHWFFADSNKELFYLEKEGRILFFQICYKDKILEMDENSFFTLGEVESYVGEKIKGSDIITVDGTVDLTVVKSFIRYIQGINAINQDHKDLIVAKIENYYLSAK